MAEIAEAVQNTLKKQEVSLLARAAEGACCFLSWTLLASAHRHKSATPRGELSPARSSLSLRGGVAARPCGAGHRSTASVRCRPSRGVRAVPAIAPRRLSPNRGSLPRRREKLRAVPAIAVLRESVV